MAAAVWFASEALKEQHFSFITRSGVVERAYRLRIYNAPTAAAGADADQRADRSPSAPEPSPRPGGKALSPLLWE